MSSVVSAETEPSPVAEVEDVAASVNPADLLTAALEPSDVTEEELSVVDASLDAMMLEENGSALKSGKPLISIEEAAAKLSPEILEVLSKKFKGSLTQTRHIDERDQIF